VLFAPNEEVGGGDRIPLFNGSQRPRAREITNDDFVGHAVVQESFGGDDGCDIVGHETALLGPSSVRFEEA
jgi:hypothetical protein